MKKNILPLSLLLLVVIIFSSFVYRNGTGEKVSIEKSKVKDPACFLGTFYRFSGTSGDLATVNACTPNGGNVVMRGGCGKPFIFTKVSGNGTLSTIYPGAFSVSGSSGQTMTVRITTTPYSGVRIVTFNFQ